MKKVTLLFLAISLPGFILLTNCARVTYREHKYTGHPNYEGRPEPPPHAPAHGYRRKYSYQYYPSSFVYYDAGRKIYFYLDEGQWSSTRSLPRSIRIHEAEAVRIDVYSDTPYVEFHVHQQQYPPGGENR